MVREGRKCVGGPRSSTDGGSREGGTPCDGSRPPRIWNAALRSGSKSLGYEHPAKVGVPLGLSLPSWGPTGYALPPTRPGVESERRGTFLWVSST